MADTPGATTGYELPSEALLHPAPLIRAGRPLESGDSRAGVPGSSPLAPDP
jgi:hypothetical protein